MWELPTDGWAKGSSDSSVTVNQVGYWSVGRANCQCADTPFWQYIDKYESQWSYVEKAISWAAKYQIGVLVDFHGAEGSQNGWGELSILHLR
jgi:aryl-phospho-beta-D-glucosidase BglC (GH1 family)